MAATRSIVTLDHDGLSTPINNLDVSDTYAQWSNYIDLGDSAYICTHFNAASGASLTGTWEIWGSNTPDDDRFVLIASQDVASGDFIDDRIAGFRYMVCSFDGSGTGNVTVQVCAKKGAA